MTVIRVVLGPGHRKAPKMCAPAVDIVPIAGVEGSIPTHTTLTLSGSGFPSIHQHTRLTARLEPLHLSQNL